MIWPVCIACTQFARMLIADVIEAQSSPTILVKIEQGIQSMIYAARQSQELAAQLEPTC